MTNFLLDTVLYYLFITLVVAAHLFVAYEILTLIFDDGDCVPAPGALALLVLALAVVAKRVR